MDWLARYSRRVGMRLLDIARGSAILSDCVFERPGEWPGRSQEQPPGSPGSTASSAAASPPIASTSSMAIPGVGKTTLALQFLLEGVRLGERCLYVSLSETKDELDARRRFPRLEPRWHHLIELSQVEQTLAAKSQNTLFQPAEVELGNLSRLLTAEFDRVEPARMVLDSLSEMRLMAQSALRYRREILRAQAALRDAPVHRAAARRSQPLRAGGPGAEHRARRWSPCRPCRSSSASTGASSRWPRCAARVSARATTTT